MGDLVRATWAELLKLKRTLALRIAVGAPLAQVLLTFVIYLQRRMTPAPGQNPILGFAQLNLTGWTILVLPLYAALAAALVAAVDHQGDNWKHLLALPVPRWSLFAAKWVVAGGLLLGSSLVLTVAIVGTSELLTLMNPTLRATSIPAVLVMTRALQTCCAAGLIVSLQLWVSLRWRSFIPGLAVGVLGVMILLGGVARAGVGTIAIYLYPWALPPMAMARMAEVHHDRVLVSAGGLLAGIMVGIFGCWQLSRRDAV